MQLVREFSFNVWISRRVRRILRYPIRLGLERMLANGRSTLMFVYILAGSVNETREMRMDGQA